MLNKLLILLSLAYLKSIVQGMYIKSKQVQEYLSRKTESCRKYARHSIFYIGLWGELWVDSILIELPYLPQAASAPA